MLIRVYWNHLLIENIFYQTAPYIPMPKGRGFTAQFDKNHTPPFLYDWILVPKEAVWLSASVQNVLASRFYCAPLLAFSPPVKQVHVLYYILHIKIHPIYILRSGTNRPPSAYDRTSPVSRNTKVLRLRHQISWQGHKRHQMGLVLPTAAWTHQCTTLRRLFSCMSGVIRLTGQVPGKRTRTTL